jgi:hypothetical protein
MLAKMRAAWEHGALVWRDDQGNPYRVDGPHAIFSTFLEYQTATCRPFLMTADAGGTQVSAASSATAGTVGVMSIGTDGDTEDKVEITSPISFNSSYGPVAIARIKLDDEDACAFNFGFSDAAAEADDKIAFTYATATLTSNASDGVLVFHDADATANKFRAASTAAAGDSTVIDIEAASETWHDIKLVTNVATRLVDVYWDDTYVDTTDVAMDASTQLCLYLGFITRGNAEETVQVDYMGGWHQVAY